MHKTAIEQAQWSTLVIPEAEMRCLDKIVRLNEGLSEMSCAANQAAGLQGISDELVL